ncbi:hypothetical protein [Acidovorax radicis]|uniref:hypothetical protein n=1 Tax=Acidovorax radicis TaxID=758826 RepID=UPI003134271F
MELFYRVESSRNRQSGGAGPGLTIASDVVRRHGGRAAGLAQCRGWWFGGSSHFSAHCGVSSTGFSGFPSRPRIS